MLPLRISGLVSIEVSLVLRPWYVSMYASVISAALIKEAGFVLLLCKRNSTVYDAALQVLFGRATYYCLYTLLNQHLPFHSVLHETWTANQASQY